MSRRAIRPHRPLNLDRWRELWTQLTQRHHDLYNDPTVGGDGPGRQFGKHLAGPGAEHTWVAQ